MNKLKTIYKKQIYDQFQIIFPIFDFLDLETSNKDITFKHEINNIQIFKILTDFAKSFLEIPLGFKNNDIYLLLNNENLFYCLKNQKLTFFDSKFKKITFNNKNVINYIEELNKNE